MKHARFHKTWKLVNRSVLTWKSGNIYITTQPYSNSRLSDSEGRAAGLEVELAKTDHDRRDVEYKLGALYSALRRTLGISRMGRSASPMRGKQSRSPSPQRRNQRNTRFQLCLSLYVCSLLKLVLSFLAEWINLGWLRSYLNLVLML